MAGGNGRLGEWVNIGTTITMTCKGELFEALTYKLKLYNFR